MEYDYLADMSVTGGRTWYVDSEKKAEQVFLESYPKAVFGDNWDDDGIIQRTGARKWRRLVWQNEKIAGKSGAGDDGSHAVGEIIRIEKTEGGF
jgi:hypothetical protein